jgi:hypothetical protein
MGFSGIFIMALFEIAQESTFASLVQITAKAYHMY